MIMTEKGFAVLRSHFGSLKQSQVDGINIIIEQFNAQGVTNYNHAAYMLATTWHETAKTMQPIEEYGKGKGRFYGTWYKNSKGLLYSFINGFKKVAYLFNDHPHLYYGRGYVQLTWFENYQRASKKLGVDFINNPALALDPKLAADIMIVGMREGWFTGKKLDDYISGNKKDYVSARKIINGLDKAKLIADYSAIFEKALRQP